MISPDVCKAIKAESYKFKKQINKEPDNHRVLVVGDLHLPFTHENYLGFCKRIYKQYKCNKVVFIGDIIDNHYTSYHETDPDGMSAGGELDLCIDKLRDWYKLFPKADVVLGNHGRMAYRKAMSGGISKQWIREFKDVLHVPKWNFKEDIEIDGVLYVHGEGRQAQTRAKNELVKVVQGHYHTKLGVNYFVGQNYIVFAMSVGCGIDRKSYAMAYGKHFAKPALGCGVVINGELAIPIPMVLGRKFEC